MIKTRRSDFPLALGKTRDKFINCCSFTRPKSGFFDINHWAAICTLQWLSLMVFNVLQQKKITKITEVVSSAKFISRIKLSKPEIF